MEMIPFFLLLINTYIHIYIYIYVHGKMHCTYIIIYSIYIVYLNYEHEERKKDQINN